MARVLIVDDSDIVRKALELAIRKMGHDVQSTPSPHDALVMALCDPPDLALLDFRMPEMDGAELFTALDASLGDRCPRVVFVSATPREVVRASSPAHLRPDGYVTKPFRLDELTRKVSEVLAR